MEILRRGSVEGFRRGFADAIRGESVEMFRAPRDSADRMARGGVVVVAAAAAAEIVGGVQLLAEAEAEGR